MNTVYQRLLGKEAYAWLDRLSAKVFSNQNDFVTAQEIVANGGKIEDQILFGTDISSRILSDGTLADHGKKISVIYSIFIDEEISSADSYLVRYVQQFTKFALSALQETPLQIGYHVIRQNIGEYSPLLEDLIQHLVANDSFSVPKRGNLLNLGMYNLFLHRYEEDAREILNTQIFAALGLEKELSWVRGEEQSFVKVDIDIPADSFPSRIHIPLHYIFARTPQGKKNYMLFVPGNGESLLFKGRSDREIIQTIINWKDNLPPADLSFGSSFIDNFHQSLKSIQCTFTPFHETLEGENIPRGRN